MKVKRIGVSLLCAVTCASFAVAVGQASQASMQGRKVEPQGVARPVNLQNIQSLRLTRATSLKDVKKVRGEMEKGFNAFLGNDISSAASESTFVNTSVYKDVIDKTVYKTTTSATLMSSLPEADLKGLRALITARFDESIRTGNLGAIGEGQVSKSFFTGKIAAPTDTRSLQR